MDGRKLESWESYYPVRLYVTRVDTGDSCMYPCRHNCIFFFKITSNVGYVDGSDASKVFANKYRYVSGARIVKYWEVSHRRNRSTSVAA